MRSVRACVECVRACVMVGVQTGKPRQCFSTSSSFSLFLVRHTVKHVSFSGLSHHVFPVCHVFPVHDITCLLFRFDLYGIYVVMFLEILRTLVQVIVVFSILFVAFGLAFYILLATEVGGGGAGWGWAVLCCAGLGWAVLGCAGLCWAGLGWAGLGWAGLSGVGQGKAGGAGWGGAGRGGRGVVWQSGAARGWAGHGPGRWTELTLRSRLLHHACSPLAWAGLGEAGGRGSCSSESVCH